MLAFSGNHRAPLHVLRFGDYADGSCSCTNYGDSLPTEAAQSLIVLRPATYFVVPPSSGKHTSLEQEESWKLRYLGTGKNSGREINVLCPRLNLNRCCIRSPILGESKLPELGILVPLSIFHFRPKVRFVR